MENVLWNIQNSIEWDKFIDAYFPSMITWITLSTLIALPEYSLGYSFLQALFLCSWTYWGHYLAHYLSLLYPFNLLNTHISIHHNKMIVLPRWLELFCESINNFLLFFIFYIWQSILGIHLLSTTMILGSAFLYIAIHILEYSLYGNKDHKEHHAYMFCNYQPTAFDTFFNTRCDSKPAYINNTNEIPHIVGAFGLAYVLKKFFHLD